MMLMKKVFILSVSLGFLSSGQTFFKFSYSKKAFFGVPKVILDWNWVIKS